MKNNYKKRLDKIEKEWREEKEKCLHPFDLRAYVKATNNYFLKMREETIKALSEVDRINDRTDKITRKELEKD